MAKYHCFEWWERPWVRLKEFPPLDSWLWRTPLYLACANAVRDVWEEDCWYANLPYVCHKAKLSCPWHARGGDDSSATSCSILHWGGTGRWKGPEISQVAMDSHSNWLSRWWEGAVVTAAASMAISPWGSTSIGHESYTNSHIPTCTIVQNIRVCGSQKSHSYLHTNLIKFTCSLSVTKMNRLMKGVTQFTPNH